MLDTIMRMFAREGFVPWPCSSLHDVQRAFRCEIRPVAVLTDIALRGETGRAIVEWVRNNFDVPVWLMSGYGNLASLGGERIASKPIDIDAIRSIAKEIRGRELHAASR